MHVVTLDGTTIQTYWSQSLTLGGGFGCLFGDHLILCGEGPHSDAVAQYRLIVMQGL